MNINPLSVNLDLENMEEKSVCSASTPEDSAISTIQNISSSRPIRSGKSTRFDEFSPEFNQTILSDVCLGREYDQLAQFAEINQPAQLNPYTISGQDWTSDHPATSSLFEDISANIDLPIIHST